MKSLKFLWVLALTAGVTLFFTSCKKDNDVVNTVTKQQLVGKWDFVIQSAGLIQKAEATVKGSGTMELDVVPTDGVPDLIVFWDLQGNNFNAHVDANGVAPFWELHGKVDPATLSMAGDYKMNDPSTPQSGIFTMDKK